MTSVIASLGFIICGFGCIWIVRNTPKDTPVWFDGLFLLGALAFWGIGIFGLLKAALR